MRSHPLVPAQQLRQARQRLTEQGLAASPGVDALLARSWQRSLTAGLSPIGRLHCQDNLVGPALQRSRALSHELISHSEPVMEHLFEQVRHSHSMVILADPQGVLMHTRGDLDFLSKAERVALTCGASWAESQRGTNAIGTALAEAQEVEIHGAEHYLERNGFLTCAAAPIFSAQGQLAGILDISGEQRSRHPHTLGLVGTAARMIENSLVMASCRHQLVLQFHAKAEGIGSVAQGLLAFSEDGWLVGANRRGLALLGLGAVDLQRTAWAQLFERALQAWLGSLRQSGGRPLQLRTQRGEVFYGQLQGRGPTVVTMGSAPTARAASPEPVRADALQRLDSGDLRWRAAADKARRVLGKDIPLLILGESGVGKELFAKALHEVSTRRGKPFVAVNCAALPESLIESELFGYAPGAFTGARSQGSPGRLREAQGGTLFLDEIGDMPLALQTRLLRVLQEREVQPLGGGAPVALDVQLLCATHQSLAQAVSEGRFRADLYYRINGLALQLPALRERTDLDALVDRVIESLAPDQGLALEPDLREALRAYDWPGNLRQLHQVLRTAVALLTPQDSRIGWAHLPDDLVAPLQQRVARPVRPAQNLRELSQQAIAQALENTRGNVSAAARQLGIARQTLYRRLQAGAAD
ncbi:sigma-54-dependent Fis family transcriptional regulator [Pelomonas sp. APW6]|uniref:Sigma-54-dependent Fis family transcriptional regulator n=1 Tax=Roseateles subflavus TaxID=3053353 RepID=A0ABT7LC67_9BURK|nr:sigma-54-dependent Fis family transcriptional regulator [Pelomonas sp. APW6]MDL5030455.1 sigma-54-dependent Fis family transcriptional regulator [Pelomonas sp. APW6]